MANLPQSGGPYFASGGNYLAVAGPYFNDGRSSAGVSCVQAVTTGGTITGGSFTLSSARTPRARLPGAPRTRPSPRTSRPPWSPCPTWGPRTPPAPFRHRDVGDRHLCRHVRRGAGGAGRADDDDRLEGAHRDGPDRRRHVTTAGVTATMKGSYPGTRVTDSTNNREYANVGTANVPKWALAGCRIGVATLVGTTATTGGAMDPGRRPRAGRS